MAEWFRQHALAIITGLATLLFAAVMAIVFLYQLAQSRLPTIEKQLADNASEFKNHVVRFQAAQEDLMRRGYHIERISKLEAAITALRAAVIDMRTRMGKRPTPAELRELVSSVQSYGDARAEVFEGVTLTGAVDQLPDNPPAWKGSLTDISRLLPSTTHTGARPEIGKALAYSLLTPHTRFVPSDTGVKAIFPGGETTILFKTKPYKMLLTDDPKIRAQLLADELMRLSTAVNNTPIEPPK